MCNEGVEYDLEIWEVEDPGINTNVLVKSIIELKNTLTMWFQ